MPISSHKPIAIFACLPPTDSAIGRYTLGSFGSSSRPIHFFSSHNNASNWIECKKLINKNPHHSLYHADLFREAYRKFKYEDALFVLGNSFHHETVMKSLLRYSHIFPIKKHLYIHEAQLTYALLPAFSENTQVLLNFFKLHYPEKEKVLRSFEDIFKHEIYGIRVIAALSNPTSIITNSTFCSKIVNRELTLFLVRPRIHHLFLPIIKESAFTGRKGLDILKIGSFGIPHPVKHLDRVVAACDLLIKEGTQLDLLLAGPQISQFLKTHRLQRPFITAVDSPNDQQMDALMQSVDLGIQLRWPSHGESSACVNELLALEKKVLVTDTGSFSDLHDFTIQTPIEVSPEDLSSSILSATKTEPNFLAYKREYSAQNFQAKCFEFIQSFNS